MTIFKDSHHFSRTLGSLWWQSLMTVFNGNAFFWKNPSRPLSGKRRCKISFAKKLFLFIMEFQRKKRRCKISCVIWPFFENNFTALCRFTQFISCICTATTFVSWWDAIPGRKLQIGWLVASYREIYNLQCLALNYTFVLIWRCLS